MAGWSHRHGCARRARSGPAVMPGEAVMYSLLLRRLRSKLPRHPGPASGQALVASCRPKPLHPAWQPALASRIAGNRSQLWGLAGGRCRANSWRGRGAKCPVEISSVRGPPTPTSAGGCGSPRAPSRTRPRHPHQAEPARGRQRPLSRPGRDHLPRRPLSPDGARRRDRAAFGIRPADGSASALLLLAAGRDSCWPGGGLGLAAMRPGRWPGIVSVTVAARVAPAQGHGWSRRAG